MILATKMRNVKFSTNKMRSHYFILQPATQCAESTPAAEKASDSDDIDLFASDDDDVPAAKVARFA